MICEIENCEILFIVNNNNKNNNLKLLIVNSEIILQLKLILNHEAVVLRGLSLCVCLM